MFSRSRTGVGMFAKRSKYHPDPKMTRRLMAVREAMLAICDGRWDDAEGALTLDGATAPRDAVFLNLLGVVSQARHRWKEAKRCYGKAMRKGNPYAPAEQNMRRLYELETFGRTDLPISLIDGSTAGEIAARSEALRMRQ